MRKLLTAAMVAALCTSISFPSLTAFAQTSTNQPQAPDSQVVKVTDATYDQAVQQSLKAGKPVFVDYYAWWCGPCKNLKPIIDDLSIKYGSQVTFLRIDASVYTKTANKEHIKVFPTQKVFWPNGQSELVGLFSADLEEQFIVNALAAAKSGATSAQALVPSRNPQTATTTAPAATPGLVGVVITMERPEVKKALANIPTNQQTPDAVNKAIKDYAQSTLPAGITPSSPEYPEAMIDRLQAIVDPVASPTTAVKIQGVVPGLPAAQAGLKEGDSIVEVGGKNVNGLHLEEASELLRGTVGTSVSVVVERADEKGAVSKVTVSLTRVQAPAKPTPNVP